MNFLNREHKIYAYSQPVDMRKSFNGLIAIVRNNLSSNPLSGHVYLFVNRAGNYLKALLWDRTGFVIISKRLERGRFSLPKDHHAQEIEVNEDILLLIFDGIKL